MYSRLKITGFYFATSSKWGGAVSVQRDSIMYSLSIPLPFTLFFLFQFLFYSNTRGNDHGPDSKQSNPSFSASDFECVKSENGFRPRHKEIKKPLGAGTFKTLETCKQAIKVSKNDIVCASTGLPGGFKPTFKAGVTPSRPDWGYVGGSSMTLEACLFATEQSLPSSICFFGGKDGVTVGGPETPGWYATHPSGNKSRKGGPYESLQKCVEATHIKFEEDKKQLRGLFESLPDSEIAQ